MIATRLDALYLRFHVGHRKWAQQLVQHVVLVLADAEIEDVSVPAPMR